MTLLDITITIILILIGLNLGKLYRGFDKREQKWLRLLFLFHFGITIVFSFYISSNGGDAIKYWNLPKLATFQEVWNLVVTRRASSFIYFINYFPSNVLSLSFFTGNLIYSVVGFLGFVYIFKIVKQLFIDYDSLLKVKFFGVPLFPWILFLPNLHFWSSGIGKDAILFFCCIAFFYGFLNLKKRFKLLLVVSLLTLIIRPHIAVFLFGAITVAYLIDGRLKGYQKLFFFLVFLVGLFTMADYLLVFIQIENFEITTLENFANNRALDLSKGRTESSIDVSSYPFILKVFTFLYRPLFFDIIGVLAILSSIENLILILFTLKIIFSKPFLGFKKGHFVTKAMPIFFLIGTLSFSLILGNLGIMLRQKNMLFPIFIVFGLWVIYSNSKYTLDEDSNRN
ncbi:MAG: hypothetical protein R2776_09525 [Flavobacteriaceae bacterium]